MNVATILLVVMWVYATVYFIFLLKDVIATQGRNQQRQTAHNIIISLVAKLLRHGDRKLCNCNFCLEVHQIYSDDLIPGSLNVSFAIPICVESNYFH